MTRWARLSLLVILLTLSACVSEAEERRQVLAEHHATCQAERNEAQRLYPAQSWERRIALNEVAERCAQDRRGQVLAAEATAYARLLKKAVDDGRVTDEQARFDYIHHIGALERQRDVEEAQLEQARIQAAGQALMGLGMSGGLFQTPSPPPMYQPVPAPPLPILQQPLRQTPPVSCSSRQVGQVGYTDCY